jgi:hypothetical protein
MNCKCKKIIPQARLDLGYTVCVECSTVEKLGCIDTINHKTGNTIQVMSRDDADQASKLTKRAGFGTLRSLRGASVKSNTKILHGCRLTSIGNQKLYEQVGKTYVDYYDVDTKLAEKYLLRMLNNLEINQLQYNTIKKLSKIIIK